MDCLQKNKQFSLTFDMDGIDVLCDGYGVSAPYAPVVYTKAVPRMLQLLSDENVKATFFIIANKVKDKSVRDAIKEMSSEGHEIANHSLDHEHYLHRDYNATEEDLRKSTALLEDIISKQIVGFRGPSLTFNKYTPELLKKYGYTYDSSIHPTPLFLGEWIYLSLFSPGKRNKPDFFFLRHAINRLAPYPVSRNSLFKKDKKGYIIEFPISTTPVFRLPYYPTFHFMVKFTEPLLRHLYFNGRRIVFLAHGLDFLNIYEDDLAPGFKAHPGLCMRIEQKIVYFKKIIANAKKNHGVCTLARQREEFRR